MPSLHGQANILRKVRHICDRVANMLCTAVRKCPSVVHAGRSLHLMGARLCSLTLCLTWSSGKMHCPSPCAHHTPMAEPPMPCRRRKALPHRTL